MEFKTLLSIKKWLLLALPAMLFGVMADAQTYCGINFPSGIEPVTYVDFAGITNTTPNTGGPALEDFTMMTATVAQGQSYTITVQGNTFGNYTNYIRVFIDWNQNGAFTDQDEVYDLGTIINSDGQDGIQATLPITVPIVSGLGPTRMRVTQKWNSYAADCNSSGYGQAEDYTVSVVASGSCTGTPVAGTVTGPSAVCLNTPFALSVTGYTAESGISFQWEEDNGSGWQPISGATNTIYASPGITTATSYQVVVTCSNGGSAEISNTIAIDINPFFQCYCPVDFTSSTEPITLVSFAGINNVTSPSAFGPAYEDFTSMVGSVMQGQNELITVKGFTNGNYTDLLRLYIDWDQNGVFDVSETYDLGTITNSDGMDAVQSVTNIAIPPTAAVGLTGMRVTKKWNTAADPCNTAGYGQAEDYSLEVFPSNACTGIPLAGTIIAPSSVCPGAGFSLSLSGYTIAAGIGVQWEYDEGSGWQPLPGATSAIYAASGITVPTSYRAVVTCSNGGQQAISNEVQLTILTVMQCYCSINFPDGVEPITLVDFAGFSNSSSAALGTPPALEDFSAITGNVAQNGVYPIIVEGNTNGPYIDHISVFIDWDQNGFLTDADELYELGTLLNSTGTDGIQLQADIAVPATAAVGATRMRVTKRWDQYATACNTVGYGQAEDYTLQVSFPLAVTLKEFGAINEGLRNRIDWTTANEFTGDRFGLEKSRDGRHFTTLATIAAKGSPSAYSYLDATPFEETTYYRLKLTDAAGKTAYSKTVSVNTGKGSGLVLEAWPNPVKDVLSLKINGTAAGQGSITISDMTGRLIRRQATEGNTASVDMTRLAAGFYLLSYEGVGGSAVIKVNKR